MKPIELNRPDTPKKQMIVRLTIKDYKTYRKHEQEIKELAEKIGASMAVKME